MADVYCKKCGQKIIEGDLFCQNCGTRVEQDVAPSGGGVPSASGPMPVAPQFAPTGGTPVTPWPAASSSQPTVCSVCGGTIKPYWTFCMRCGNKLGAESGTPAAQQGAYAAQGGASFAPNVPSAQPVTSSSETVIDRSGAYVVGAPSPRYTLTRVTTGETYTLALPATLGRGDSATVKIAGNPYIGRMHASMYEREGVLYVEDEDSSNHTFVNGAMLTAHVPMAVKEGDVIALAKEELTVSRA